MSGPETPTELTRLLSKYDLEAGWMEADTMALNRVRNTTQSETIQNLAAVLDHFLEESGEQHAINAALLRGLLSLMNEDSAARAALLREFREAIA
ncbi:MAG: hypothetical protein ABR888_00040 [Thermoplasmata archaeon]|jgi:hypothetical protein